jgi:high-affinity iron transporter
VIGSLFVTLREGFEAALMVGIVLAYLNKSGAPDRARHVWTGVGAAAVVSVLMGLIIYASGNELSGTSEAVYEGTAMLLATGVLTWMIFWMQRQARTLGSHLREQVSTALVAGGTALFWVSFVGVAREGIETSLFMYAATSKDSALSTISGGTIGLVIAAILGVLVYRGSHRLNLGRFFQATSVILLAFAAYLLMGGLHELGEAAKNEPLEEASMFVAGLYVLGTIWLYLRPPAGLARVLSRH